MAKVYQRLASLVAAYKNCKDKSFFMPDNNAKEWAQKHFESILEIVENHMPRGSGFDNGVFPDLHYCNDKQLVFETSFHHMNADGFYCGWSGHVITVTANLAFDFDIKITSDFSGVDDKDLCDNDFIVEEFSYCLHKDIE